MNDPPDLIGSNFRTIKVPLKKVLNHSNIIQPKIEDAILKINEICMRAYEFIKLYFINLMENNQDLPKIDRKFLTVVFNLIGENSRKRRLGDTLIDEFYDSVFSQIYPTKINTVHLSYSLAIEKDNIIKNIETNIKSHFDNYLFRYINVALKSPEVEKIKNDKDLNSDEKKIKFKNLYDEIKRIKKDFMKLTIHETE